MKIEEAIAKAALVSALVLLAGCATTPTKQALFSPAYLGPISSQQMLEMGKNDFGVPATAFSFYPQDWTPKYWKENPKVFSDAPMWDGSEADPPSVSHDCFVPSRLFVIPWGSGKGQVGIPKGTFQMGMQANPDLSYYDGCRFLPDVQFVAGREIYVWDWVNQRTFVYDYNGTILQSFEQSDFDFYRTVDVSDKFYLASAGVFRTPQGTWFNVEGDTFQGGVITTYNPSNKATECKVYFPGESAHFIDSKDSTDNFCIRQPDQQASYSATIDDDANIMLVRFSNAGVEIWRYQEK